MKYLVYLLVLANIAFLGWNIHMNQIAGEVARELPVLPAGVTPLVTLQELDSQRDNAEAVSGVEVLTNARPPGAGAALTCLAIGPFPAVENLQSVSQELQLHGVQARQRTAEIQKPNGYWVHLPAMKREQVLRAVKTLEDNKDHEYYVGKGNLLSLGIFDEMPRAETRLRQARKLGFDPLLETRYQTSTEYWLDIEAHPSATDELDTILQGRPGLELQDITCP